MVAACIGVTYKISHVAQTCADLFHLYVMSVLRTNICWRHAPANKKQKQNPNAGNSHMAECQSLKVPKRFTHFWSSEQHSGTNQLTGYDFLLVYCSDLRSSWNHCSVISRQSSDDNCQQQAEAEQHHKVSCEPYSLDATWLKSYPKLLTLCQFALHWAHGAHVEKNGHTPRRCNAYVCCRLELRKGRRRLAWEGTPHSIQIGIQSIISTGECLSFNSHTAALFADNGNLAINVTICPYSYWSVVSCCWLCYKHESPFRPPATDNKHFCCLIVDTVI